MVIQSHARLMVTAGERVTVIAGSGDGQALPAGTEFELVPEMDSQHPAILRASQELEQGRIPASFEQLTGLLQEKLTSILAGFDRLIVHNVFTKHFNLPLTVAILRLLDKGDWRGWIAWCHDLTWTSPHSRSKVHPGYPWDALRTYRPELTYVAVSRQRQRELAGLLGVPIEDIKVIYNGVSPEVLLGLSPEGKALTECLGLWKGDLALLMPVRITQAKNIEFAMRVVAALKERGVRPTLVISGPPDPHDQSNMEYYRGLKQLRGQMNLDEEIRFVYDTAGEKGQPGLIDMNTLGELYRASDLLFMPSHREGFGMPVLEAGLVGLPVVCANIPAAEEIGGQEVLAFPGEATPDAVANLIQNWVETSKQYRLRQRIRTNYTWQAIFDHDILPLLEGVRTA